MANLSLISHSVIGHPTDTIWSQFWENQSQDPDLKEKRGRLFGLVTIHKESSDKDISTIGKELISFFNEIYFKDSSEPIFDHLKKTLRKVGEEHPVFVEGDLKTSLIIAVRYQNFIYLGTYGEGIIKLIRDQESATLVTGIKTKPQLVSGQLKPLDRYLFLSSHFLSVFPWENHEDKFKDKDPGVIKEFLSTLVYSQKDSADLSVIILDTKKDENSSPEKDSFLPDPTSLPAQPTPPEKKRKPFFGKKIKLPKIKVHDYPTPQLDRRRRVSAIIAIGFLILLFTSVYFGSQKRQADLAEQKYQDLSQQINDRLSTAQTLKNLDLEDALSITKEAQNLLQELEELDIHPEETSSLKTTVNTLLSQTGQEGTFSPDILYDLSLIRSEIKVKSLSLENSTLYLLDTDSHRIDQLNVSKKSTELVLNNDELSKTFQITASNNTIYLLGEGGIYKTASDSIQKIVEKDDSWVDPVDIISWEGKVYVLTKDNIYKYPLTASGLGSRQEWLKGDLGISTPTSLAINGKVWVLGKSGTVKPYYLGREDKYDQSSITAIKDANHLTTHPDLDIVVFTDQQKDIYLFDKEGKSIAKYSTNLTILDLVLDALNSRLLILANDQKLYQITLN